MDATRVDWNAFAAQAEQQPPAEVLLTLRTELMTCITIIRGFTDLAGMGGEAPRAAISQEGVDAMRQATDQMQWMLNRVLLPLMKRLMPDDEPKRAIIESLIQQCLEQEHRERNALCTMARECTHRCCIPA